MRALTIVMWLGVIGCGGKGEDSTETATGSTGPSTPTTIDRSEIITVTTPVVGDLACHDPAGDWGAQTVDPSCKVLADVTGDIEDFQSGDGVAGAKIEVFYDDLVGDTPDATLTSDNDGLVSGGQAYTCSAFTSRITHPIEPPDAKVTIQQHWTEGPGATVDTFFNSVSIATYVLMPAILQIEPDPTKGILAGTAYDCGGEGSLLENAQVIVRSGDGTYPLGQEIRYFVEEFPNKDQPATSADGLWMAINIPAGPHVVELWGVIGSGEAQLLASTPVDVVADGITVADLYSGDDDGVKFDEACLSACP